MDSIERRWVITTPGRPIEPTVNGVREQVLFAQVENSLGEEATSWERQHGLEDYENVWSMTEDERVRRAIVESIEPNMKRVLIPGCGSRIELQQQILADAPWVQEIVCTDWAKPAIEVAQRRLSHPRVRYIQQDTATMSELDDASFDVVVIVNSILSANDLFNRRMVLECARVLRRGGRLCGFFPSILAALEISYLDTRFAKWRNGAIDLVANSFVEDTQNMRQIFYTPLRLNQILVESGLTRERFEIFICDSQYFTKESERIYGLPEDSGLSVWEIFVSAVKPWRQSD